MRRIINLTQHPATPEQIAEGVFEPEDRIEINRLLTFERRPDRGEVRARASALAEIAAAGGADAAMLGGAPFLMAPLEHALRDHGIVPIYAFSRRESAEVRLADGSVRKTQLFRHEGWVVV
jgi:hypothetical protein